MGEGRIKKNVDGSECNYEIFEILLSYKHSTM
jgi:hypothetical protein